MVLLAAFFGKSNTINAGQTTSQYCRIFQIPKLGTKLKQDSIPLSYTPRKFITHPTNQYFYMIEGDHRVMGQEAANKRIDELVR